MEMPCTHVTGLLDPYWNDELGAGEARDVECHLESCSECREFADWVTRGVVEARTLLDAVEPAGPAFTDRVMAEVASFDASRRPDGGAEREGRSDRHPRWSRYRLLTGLLAAAGLILAVWFVFPQHEVSTSEALAMLSSDAQSDRDAALTMLEHRVDADVASSIFAALHPLDDLAFQERAIRIAMSVDPTDVAMPRWIIERRSRLEERDLRAPRLTSGPANPARANRASADLTAVATPIFHALIADSFGASEFDLPDESVAELFASTQVALLRAWFEMNPEQATPAVVEALVRSSAYTVRVAAAHLLASGERRRDAVTTLLSTAEDELARKSEDGLRGARGLLVNACMRSARHLLRDAPSDHAAERLRLKELALAIVELAASCSDAVTRAAVAALESELSRDDAITLAASLVSDSSFDTQSRVLALRLLRPHWSAPTARAIAAPLVECLLSEDSDLRLEAQRLIRLNALGPAELGAVARELGNAVPVIIELLEDPASDDQQQQEAALALVALATDARAEATLLRLFRRHDGAAVIDSLARMKELRETFANRRWITPIVEIAADDTRSSRVRMHAIDALGDLWRFAPGEFPESFPQLLLALIDGDTGLVSFTAARNLLGLHDAGEPAVAPELNRIFARLKELLNGDTTRVRLGALRKLEQHGRAESDVAGVVAEWFQDERVSSLSEYDLRDLLMSASSILRTFPDRIPVEALERIAQTQKLHRAGMHALRILALAGTELSSDFMRWLDTDTWRRKAVAALIRHRDGAPGSADQLAGILREAPEKVLVEAGREWIVGEDVHALARRLERGGLLSREEILAIIEVVLNDTASASQTSETGSTSDALDSFMALRDEIVRRARARLADGDRSQRLKAVRLLALVDSDEAAGLLLRASRDADTEVADLARVVLERDAGQWRLPIDRIRDR